MSKGFIELFIDSATKRHTLGQGNFLFHQDDPVRSVFVVEEGQIELVRYSHDGASLVVQRATSQMLLAEASVYSESYHCDAVAALPSRVLELPKAAFLEHLHEDEVFFNAWAAHLAREVQSARYRSEIMSRKTVAERLDGWLAWPGNTLPSKGQWKNIAVEIGVSPEALYREFAKRRPE